MKLLKSSFSMVLLYSLFFIAFFISLLSCDKQLKQKAENHIAQSEQAPLVQPSSVDYSDSCIKVARLWLEKNKLPDLIERFENEQKEQSEIDHSINYLPGGFIVSVISSAPRKFSVSYHNSSTNATFVITWIVDFTARRVYANPNEYGYDKEGVHF